MGVFRYLSWKRSAVSVSMLLLSYSGWATTRELNEDLHLCRSYLTLFL